ncbi:MAG: hypothetical protein LBV33_01405 [Lachnospiraceae bacterium]|jgi:glucosylceramidase|nr:hypothetical protein [Lachnospiraceae bacterium]
MPKVFITDKSGKKKAVTGSVFQEAFYSGLPQVNVCLNMPRQTMLGFGIAVTDASCHLLAGLEEDQRARLLGSIFGEGGLGLSIARLSVGASDYACDLYNYDDLAGDMELTRFSIEHDRQHILPILRAINRICPELFYFSSVWSAPGWMKTGGSMCGGWLREEYLEVFARYYTRFLEEYKKEGIDVRALTSQNEPETDQCGRMPACYLHPEFEQRIVRDHLAPILREKGLDTEIWIHDHNFIQWNRAKWMLDDEATKAVVDGVAFHYYEGTADMATALHEAHPGTAIHWTEGGPNLGDEYETDWCYWGRIFTEALNNWCSSITGWNLALDEKGRPNIGSFSCAGLVTIHSETNTVTYSGQYHAFAHFGPFIKRGASQLVTTGPNGQYHHTNRKISLYHTAFRNPDQSCVLIFTNPDEQQEISLQIGMRRFRLILPADSLVTMVFEPEELMRH